MERHQAACHSPLKKCSELATGIQFVADSATTRLSFRDISGVDDNYSFVDNVSVSAIPEPATALLVGLGLVGMAAGRRV